MWKVEVYDCPALNLDALHVPIFVCILGRVLYCCWLNSSIIIFYSWTWQEFSRDFLLTVSFCSFKNSFQEIQFFFKFSSEFWTFSCPFFFLVHNNIVSDTRESWIVNFSCDIMLHGIVLIKHPMSSAINLLYMML